METFLLRFKKPILICTGILVFYALIGFVVLPWVLSSKIPEIVQEQTGKKSTLTDVAFDPFSLKLSIKGFALNEEDNSKIFTLKELYVNLGLWSSIRYGALALDKVYLDEPLLSIVKREDSSLNLADLASSEETAPEPETEDDKPFPVWLGVIKINDGQLDIADLSLPEPYYKQITNLDLDIAQLATIALDDQVNDTLSLKFADGGSIGWRGDIELAPVLTVQGHIDVADFNSEILWEYLKYQMQYDIQSGKWDLSTDYKFTLTDTSTEFSLSNSRIALHDLMNIGGLLEWQGQVDVLPKTQSNGQVKVSGVSLATLWEYVPEDVEFKISQGTLTLASNYQFSIDEASDDNESVMHLDLDAGQIALNDVLEQGDSITWQGKASVLPEIQSSGSIAINELDWHQIWLQTQKQFDLKITQGKLNLNTNYNVQLVEGEEQPRLQLLQASISSHDVAISALDNDKTLVAVKNVAIDGLDLDLQKRKVSVQSVSTSNGSILALIDKNGEVNLSSSFTGRTTGKVIDQTEEALPEATSNPWLFNVENIKLSDFAVDATQLTATDPIHLKIKPINVAVNNFNNTPKSKFQINSDITINDSGKINSKGKMSLKPLAVDINVNASKLALSPFQPYLDQSTHIELIRGEVALKSKVKVKQNKSGKTAVNVSGNVAINNLKTLEADTKKDFLKWKAFQVKQFNLSLDPVKLNVAAININALDTKVIVNKDSSTNLSHLFSAPNQQKTAPKKQSAQKSSKPKAEQDIDISIKAVNIKDSSSFYADRSLILPFAANIKKLNGSVKNISTRKGTRSKVHLEGKANQTAPVLIKGELEPFAVTNYLDILMQFDNMNLTGLTPYMAEFAGYKIEKGKLSVDLSYKINNEELAAENRIVIDQLTLGEEVDSPNSANVPVKLALGLLKNQQGVIDLNLPIEGDLNDPEFSIMGVLGDVLLNLITKVVASPFTVMNSLLNTDADLSKVTFTAGSAILEEDQKQTLDALAKGLTERPQLQLGIRGVAYTVEDSIGLTRLDIIKQVKTEAWHDLRRAERPAEIDDVPLPEEEYHELIIDLYDDKFEGDADILIDQAEDATDAKAASVFYEQMLEQLAKITPATQAELERLSSQRARAISEYLSEQQGIPIKRIFILGQVVRDKAENNETSVELELDVDG